MFLYAWRRDFVRNGWLQHASDDLEREFLYAWRRDFVRNPLALLAVTGYWLSFLYAWRRDFVRNSKMTVYRLIHGGVSIRLAA